MRMAILLEVCMLFRAVTVIVHVCNRFYVAHSSLAFVHFLNFEKHVSHDFLDFFCVNCPLNFRKFLILVDATEFHRG